MSEYIGFGHDDEDNINFSAENNDSPENSTEADYKEIPQDRRQEMAIFLNNLRSYYEQKMPGKPRAEWAESLFDAIARPAILNEEQIGNAQKLYEILCKDSLGDSMFKEIKTTAHQDLLKEMKPLIDNLEQRVKEDHNMYKSKV